MTATGDDTPFRPGGKEGQVALRAVWRSHRVLGAVQHDSRYGDRRSLGQAALDRVKARLAWRIAVTVTVGVDHHVDEVRIVERCCGALERRVVEAPARGPLPPEKPADVAPVRCEAGPAALHVEVPLVPVGALLDGRQGPGRPDRVLHVVAADRHQGSHALGGQDADDARSPATPVVAGKRHARQAQRVHEIEEVLANRRLLRHPRRRRVEEARRAISAQIRNKDAMPGGHERRRDIIPRPDIVGKTMEQDDREPAEIAPCFVGDLQVVRVDRFDLDRHSHRGSFMCSSRHGHALVRCSPSRSSFANTASMKVESSPKLTNSWADSVGEHGTSSQVNGRRKPTALVVEDSRMAWRQVLQWLGIVLITAGCASAGGGASAGAADRCIQSGGRWIASLETCEKAASGGY